jgi:hypothetical protein
MLFKPNAAEFTPDDELLLDTDGCGTMNLDLMPLQ